jgi:hypothetical protein
LGYIPSYPIPSLWATKNLVDGWFFHWKYNWSAASKELHLLLGFACSGFGRGGDTMGAYEMESTVSRAYFIECYHKLLGAQSSWSFHVPIFNFAMVSADNCSTLWLSPPIGSSCCHPGYLWRGHPVMMVRRCIRRRSSDHLAITRSSAVVRAAMGPMSWCSWKIGRYHEGWSRKRKGFQQDFRWSWYRFMNFSPGRKVLFGLSD